MFECVRKEDKAGRWSALCAETKLSLLALSEGSQHQQASIVSCLTVT